MRFNRHGIRVSAYRGVSVLKGVGINDARLKLRSKCLSATRSSKLACAGEKKLFGHGRNKARPNSNIRQLSTARDDGQAQSESRPERLLFAELPRRALY